MKRIWIALLILILTFAMVASALGAAGDATDPVVSLSYLDEVFGPAMEEQSRDLVDKGLAGTYASQFSVLADTIGAHRLSAARADSASKSAEGTVLLKKGDLFTAAPGTQVQLKDGSVAAGTSYLIDVTNGKAVPKGSSLQKKILYMMSDSQTGDLTVASETAELYVSGVYTLTASAATDYGSIAGALHTMGLFQGTGTGYALESGATRAQGLVMFLRILGLEDEALAYTGTCPFADVPSGHWAYRYVAYAYQKGLTNGTSASQFSPDTAIIAKHYLTFLLRALHYTENTDFTYDTAPASAVRLKLFSQAEMNVLTAGTFRRSRMVYVSYYGLFGVDQAKNQLLMTVLVDGGAIRKADLYHAICQVCGKRIA